MACLLHQCYLINTKALETLPFLYELFVFVNLGYLILVVCISLRILLINIQENRDMIASSIIFLLL